MEVFRPLRTALCVYDALRFLFLIGAFIIVQPEGAIAFPWLAAISPGALFLLITLFLRIQPGAYGLYRPLYIAGKGLSVLSTVLWLFFARSDTIRGLIFSSMASFIVPGIVCFLILGDVLSAWLAVKLVN